MSTGGLLERGERFEVIYNATREVFKPSLVSVAVIVLVNLPIFALTGVEGKMFHPMAFAVIAALIGALDLLAHLCAGGVRLAADRQDARDRTTFIVAGAKRLYAPLLRGVLQARWAVTRAERCVLVIVCGWLASRHGRGIHSQPRRGRCGHGGDSPARRGRRAGRADAAEAQRGAQADCRR